MNKTIKRLLLVMLLIVRTTQALIGYDCGGISMNVTTMSAVTVGECNIPLKNPKEEAVTLQLLQLAEFGNTEVRECRVEVNRVITYCGYWYHTFAVTNGRQEYIYELDYRQCKKLQEDGSLRMGDSGFIEGIKRNSTDFRTIMLAGKTTVDGKCTGVSYSDPFGTWDGVIVEATVKITIKNYYATIERASNRIILGSGSRCEWAEGECTDQSGNYVFWEVIRDDSCTANHLTLYEGPGLILSGEPGEPEIYTLNTDEITFALSKKTEKEVCGYKLIQTEHPKLLIRIIKPGERGTRTRPIATQDLDIFTYINSKFIYVEKHIKRQMKALYRDILLHKCEVERQVISNALMFSGLKPEEFAYAIMKGPGYYASLAGEIIYLIKCVAVEVTLRKTQECYQELPVKYRNESWFLTPKSRMLIKDGTIVDCNQLLAVGYEVDGAWIIMKPDFEDTVRPQILSPLTTPTWSYEDLKHLATSGIYTEKDLEKLRNRIMLPVETPVTVNTIVRGATGRTISGNSGISMAKFIDETDIENFAKKQWDKFWGGFVIFGTASAGVIGVIMVLKFLKIIIDTAVHGYTLHRAYGWSLYLLGAILSSITHLLLHLAKEPLRNGDEEKGKRQKGNREETEEKVSEF